jgi:hypothetical protein
VVSARGGGANRENGSEHVLLASTHGTAHLVRRGAWVLGQIVGNCLEKLSLLRPLRDRHGATDLIHRFGVELERDAPAADDDFDPRRVLFRTHAVDLPVKASGAVAARPAATAVRRGCPRSC